VRRSSGTSGRAETLERIRIEEDPSMHTRSWPGPATIESKRGGVTLALDGRLVEHKMRGFGPGRTPADDLVLSSQRALWAARQRTLLAKSTPRAVPRRSLEEWRRRFGIEGTARATSGASGGTAGDVRVADAPRP
jgi:hypothetical protein